MNIKAFFVDDWPRKAAAVGLALVIWYSVYRQIQETIVIRELPVQVSTDSKLTIIDEDQIPRITLTVRGPKRVLNTLTSNSIRIHPMIPESTPTGPYQVILRDTDIDLPGRAQIMGIEPSEFTVTLDQLVTMPRSVHPIFVGDLPAGWERKNLSITPARVQVIGPASMINDIAEVNTNAITLDEKIPDYFSKDIPLATYLGVRLEPESVRVSVEYTRNDDSRTFEQLPITILNSPNSELVAAPVDVLAVTTLSGPRTVLDTLRKSSVRAFVDVSSVTQPGPFQAQVRVWVTEPACKPVTVNPGLVEVILSRRVMSTDEQPRGLESTTPAPAPDAVPETVPVPAPAPQP